MKYLWCEKEQRRMATGICEARRCTCGNYETIRREAMKQIRLTKLELTNFKGVKQFTLDLNGQDAAINGANGTGKTSLYDGFLWLLFGKDSLNSAAFEIKTIGKAGSLHNLSHEVEGVFDIDSKALTLRKTLQEKYTKKKGSSRPEFTGHEINHFIDGVPVKKGEYDTAIKDIIDEEAFKLLTNPRYFNEVLHWTKRREILMSICGDISDADVIKADKALAKLPGILGARTLDDHKKVIAAKRTEINRELERIPVRIDEAAKSMPDISGIDVSVLEADLEKLMALKTAKETELLTISAGGQVAELTKQLREVEGQIQAKENEFEADKRNRIKAAQVESDKLHYQLTEKKRTVESLSAHIKLLSQSIEDREAKLPVLRAEWKAENAKQLTFEASGTCPTCGQDLPPEKLEAAHQEAQASFNQKKAAALALNVATGKTISGEIAQLKSNIAKTEKDIEDMQPEIDRLDAEFKAIEKTIDGMSETKSKPDGVLSGKADGLRARIAGLSAEDTTQAAKQKLVSEIQALDIQAIEDRRQIALVETAGKTQARIDELQAQEKTLAAEYEKLESELFLCETFVRAKVAMLEDRINARFKLCRWKLYSEQINGGLSECCEVTGLENVPYSSLNNAARLQVGLDIINTLSIHHGVSCPIFLDNRESVTWIPEVNAQVISLIVDESAKELTININEQKQSAKAA